jgi:hypothetical protein
MEYSRYEQQWANQGAGAAPIVIVATIEAQHLHTKFCRPVRGVPPERLAWHIDAAKCRLFVLW